MDIVSPILRQSQQDGHSPFLPWSERKTVPFYVNMNKLDIGHICDNFYKTMISTEVTRQTSEGELFQDVRWRCPTYLMVRSGISVITWFSDHITLGCQLISGITDTGSLWMRWLRHCECTVCTKGVPLMHNWKIYWCTFKYYLSLWVVSCTGGGAGMCRR